MSVCQRASCQPLPWANMFHLDLTSYSCCRISSKQTGFDTRNQIPPCHLQDSREKSKKKTWLKTFFMLPYSYVLSGLSSQLFNHVYVTLLSTWLMLMPVKFYWLRARRSGDRIPVRERFSAPVQTSPGTHPASFTKGTGSFPGVKSGRGVTLTPQPLLVPLVMKE